jgi:hypothetical protein
MHQRRRLTLPLVESWFDLQPAAPQATARALHAVVLSVAPDLDMAVRSGSLVYIVERVHVMAIAPHRAQMHLQIFDGAALSAEFHELEGTAKGLRQLRLRHGQPFNEELIRRLVRATLAGAAARRSAGDGP